MAGGQGGQLPTQFLAEQKPLPGGGAAATVRHITTCPPRCIATYAPEPSESLITIKFNYLTSYQIS